jgi:hypothetical protein
MSSPDHLRRGLAVPGDFYLTVETQFYTQNSVIATSSVNNLAYSGIRFAPTIPGR